MAKKIKFEVSAKRLKEIIKELDNIGYELSDAEEGNTPENIQELEGAYGHIQQALFYLYEVK
jgi:hypothetical protein